MEELKKINYMKRHNTEYNKELKLAHQFIITQYENYLNSNKIKDDAERRAYGHAVQVIGTIAYNCKITPLNE